MPRRRPSQTEARSPTGSRIQDPVHARPPRGTIWGWLALGTVFVLALVLSFREISELDLGFHLRAGRWILENRSWPQTDPFTYTVTDHPYIDLHWLYQVMLVGLYWLGGGLALVSVHAAFTLGAFVLVSVIAWRRFSSLLILTVPLFGGVLASELRFMVRPEVVSWLFLVLTVFALERHVTGRSSPLWILPIIHLLWVNMQGLFVLGWIVQGCYLIDRLIEQRRLDRALTGWGIASVLVGFVNPYLHRGILFPLNLLTRLSEQNPFGQTIGEFTSPWRLNLSTAYPFYPRLTLWAYYVFTVGVVLVLILTWKKRRPRQFLLVLVFLILSVQAIRNIPLFVLVALPVLVAGLSDLWPGAATPRRPRGRRPARRRRAASGRVSRWLQAAPWSQIGAVLLILAAVGIGLRVVTNAYYIADRRTERFGYEIGTATMPVKAVGFMREQGIRGRLFNHLNYGGYLMWQLSEPVFIDGRLEVMGEEFYQEYLAAGQEKQLLALLDRYDAEVVIFPYLVANSWLQQLRAAPSWRMVYYDDQSVIYVREDAYPDVPEVVFPNATPDGLPIPVSAGVREKALFAPRAVGLRNWLEGFGRGQTFPREAMHTGIFFYYIDHLDAAEGFLLEALRSSQGRYYEIYNNLGAVYFKGEHYEEAAFCYQAVLQEQPGNELARVRLQEIQERR